MATKTGQYDDVKALFLISIFFAVSAALAKPFEKYFSDDETICWVLFYAALSTGGVCIGTLLAMALRSLVKSYL